MPVGLFRVACVAGLASPEKLPALAPVGPDPTTVWMTPVESTRRMRWLDVSAMYRLPSGPSVTSCGPCNCADTAGPPSPVKPGLAHWPANV